MAPNKPESWGFQGLEGLLRDLGPTEGQRKVYKRFKELMGEMREIGAGEPPDEWRPPGQDPRARKGHFITPDGKLKNLAASSLEVTLALRQNKPINSPTNREKECHGKLLNLSIKMGNLMKLQEEQVRIDAAHDELKLHSDLVTRKVNVWDKAVSAPDCSRNKMIDHNLRRPSEYNW